MKHNHSPRHHLLRTRNRVLSQRRLRKIHTQKPWHAHSNQKHKEERNPRGNFMFRRCVMLLVLHHHSQDKGRQQYFDMNRSVSSHHPLGQKINTFRYSYDTYSIK